MTSRPEKSNFNSRSSLLTAFLLFIFALIVFKLIKLQIVNGSVLRKQAEAQHSIYQKLLPSRGEIKLQEPGSLNTIPIATNLKSYLVYAVPHDILNTNLTAASLATVLQLDSKDVLAKITQADKKYVPLKKKLTEDEQNKIKDLSLPGIYFDSEDTRFYPENNLLSQVVGFVGYRGQDTSKSGLYGLEKYFQKDLVGKAGSLVAEKDTSGTVIFGANNKEQLAEDGADLILTIDKSIQFQAESVVKDMVNKNGADKGSVIIMNPKTGAILAMANYPDFDPNQFNKVENPGYFNNLATTGNYEPGSVFKAITMAAAIDQGKVTPASTYVDTGEVVVDNYHIKNSDHKAHGLQTMTQVLDESLNTGAIYAKEQIGNQDFLKYVKSFGFGQPTGIELPESQGNLDGLKANIQVNYDTATFGQGITVTPIQMLEAYGALANQGKMMRPYIIQSEIFPDGTTKNTGSKEVAQVISAGTASTMGAMLIDVVENGHGKKAGVPGYYIAGKTGTAQVPKTDGKGYDENDNIGSFIGYGPVENPQFVMLVRVDHPRDVSFAEVTAAPAWGELAQFILNYYHIAPTREIKTK